MQTISTFQIERTESNNEILNKISEQLKVFQEEFVIDIISDLNLLFTQQLEQIKDLNCNKTYCIDKQGYLDKQKHNESIRIQGVLDGINMAIKTVTDQYRTIVR
jgi:hypothetical protein